MRITIAGAGWHGSTLAARIAAQDYVDEVVMLDVVEGKPQGLALDMMHSRQIDGFHTTIIGTNRYPDTAGSTVCVIAAGERRSAGMSRHDLLDANAKIVADCSRHLVEQSPDAVLIVATNPLDEMLALAQAATNLPHRRLIGEAGVLNTARWKHVISERFGTTPDGVQGIVLGSHGETMVPIPSLTTVDGRPLRELADDAAIESITQETRASAAEIIAYLKTGSGYHAAAAAGAITVRAVAQDTGDVLPVCAWLCGEYGLDDVYLGVPTALGRDGVRRVVELPLGPHELAQLRHAAKIVDARQNEAEETIMTVTRRATGPSRHDAKTNHG
jgi:malate dehydrogenase